MIERDLGHLDIDRLLKNADAQMARSADLGTAMAGLVGRAEDELVTVTYAGTGLDDLRLHPKAMLLTSAELAERVKRAIEQAATDLRRQTTEKMEEVFGEENPLRPDLDPEPAAEQARLLRAAQDRMFGDPAGEIHRMVQRLEY
ncbi:YbaB/EbfC family DNA-binding protein [Nonomuraea sp. FMUSA5-5]|uniref:YbaB/EbfC family DNA-binding protein n=1 Tax=Nonomuraea composti TaxID=2720023 RepID=A0ABX1BGG7_9ACTN|nr:YbaB/EbfC family DNA-binding protein [Nonomuraea sp. FMUSA5-5]NJP94834.1 YbaB/EbfC family DNA-binding protein [Nonomuraea sp. FMUSA5-5]